jgi:hypothetical protein
VTLHWLDAGIDSRPIAWIQSFEIEESDTGPGLAVSGKCVRLGVPLVMGGPPGSARKIIASGVIVTTGDELILVERIWKNSRIPPPGEFLGDEGERGQVLPSLIIVWRRSRSPSCVPGNRFSQAAGGGVRPSPHAWTSCRDGVIRDARA